MTALDNLSPFAAGSVELRDYLSRHIEEGRKGPVILDPRGLGYLRPEHYKCIALAIPPEGETHDDKTGRIFIQAKF